MNVAVTTVSPHKSTVQSDVPVQLLPFQPTKADPACGTPESVTLVPQGYVALQPPPLQVTVPTPVPANVIPRLGLAEEVLKVAVIVWFVVTVTAQVALAVAQAPPQSAKVLFGAGTAVKVTTVPEDTVRVQVAPQLIPAGLEVMVPVPAPY